MVSHLRLLRHTVSSIVAALFLWGCAVTPRPDTSPLPERPTDYRIYDTAAERYLDLASLAATLAAVDVVFFGEFHDDAVTHRIQHELLEQITERRADGVLGLEMFERDVQPVIDQYTRGELSESDFLAASRPWRNYRDDYRPLVELARRRGWRVLATNLPQPMAASIARESLSALEQLPPNQRSFAAAQIECPADTYWDRFVDALNQAASESADSTAHQTQSTTDPMLLRTYQAQCARDETMAEAIAPFVGQAPVFHVNGAFHTDFHLGIVPRLLRRAPNASVRVISAFPTGDLDDPDLEDNRERGDFLVFVRG